jgi:hypothetical protein
VFNAEGSSAIVDIYQGVDEFLVDVALFLKQRVYFDKQKDSDKL